MKVWIDTSCLVQTIEKVEGLIPLELDDNKIGSESAIKDIQQAVQDSIVKLASDPNLSKIIQAKISDVKALRVFMSDIEGNPIGDSSFDLE